MGSLIQEKRSHRRDGGAFFNTVERGVTEPPRKPCPGLFHCHLAFDPPEFPKEGGSGPAGLASQMEELTQRDSNTGPKPTSY